MSKEVSENLEAINTELRRISKMLELLLLKVDAPPKEYVDEIKRRDAIPDNLPIMWRP